MSAYEFLKSHDWCQGAYAKDSSGESVWSTSDEAVSFCAYGALKRTYSHLYDSRAFDAAEKKVLAVLQRKHQTTKLAAFNDRLSATKEDILTLFEEAGV